MFGTPDPFSTLSSMFVASAQYPAERVGGATIKEQQCLKEPAPEHPDHKNVQQRLILGKSPATLQAHRMSALAPVELPKRIRLPTPSTLSTVAEAENAFEEVFNRPHPFDCLEMVEARIPGKNVAYNKTFALRRRMERAADEYLTVVNETA